MTKSSNQTTGQVVTEGNDSTRVSQRVEPASDSTHVSQRGPAPGEATGPDPQQGIATRPGDPSPPVVPIVGVKRYRIDGEIGHGGMGAVYRAWDLDLDRAVALKVLLDSIGRSPEFAARFVEEAQVAARLQHPAVVPIYDVGTDATGKFYFTMKLVDGKTLTDIVADARDRVESAREYTPFRLLEVFREICRAMAYVHEHGVVHRDLKPDNVMLGRHGEVHVMDWGIAKALSRPPRVDTGPQHTGSLPALARGETSYGTVMGTPAFMAPEQATGESPVSPLWDVYALGGILHYIVTGRIAEMAETTAGGSGVSSRGLQSPRGFEPNLPREVEAICMRALAQAPADRYPSAQALADDVQAYLEGRSVAALPEGPLRRASKWVRRRRRPLAGAGVALVGMSAALLGARQATARAALEAARVQARTAESTLIEARREVEGGHLDPSALRAGRDRLLGLGMSALAAAQTVSALAPRDAAAGRSAFEAALDLGDLALADQQWGLAVSAYERAGEAHLDDARAAKALAEVRQARDRVADEHHRLVARIIDQARQQRLDDSHYQDALFELVGLKEPDTVEALAKVLDEVAGDLWAVRRAVFLQAQTLTDDEVRRGEKPIEGLNEALEQLQARPAELGVKLTPPLRAATARLVARSRAAAAGAGAVDFRNLSAMAQEKQVGEPMLRLAHLAAEALGRIGIVGRALPALTHYLQAEDGEEGAAAAAIALCLLAQPESEQVIAQERDRLGSTNGWFWKQVGPNLRRFGNDGSVDPRTAEEYLRRSKTRAAKGDNVGAVADALRATELEPKLRNAWIGLGVAHRKSGDLPAAIAAYTRAIELVPDDATAWNDRGFAELEQGSLEPAIGDLERSLAIRPKSARTQTHRATAYRLKGDLRTALAGFEAAIQIDPRFELAFRGRGDAHRDGHELKAAISDYDQAIAIDAQDAEAWASRALAHLEAKDVEAAQADADHAVDLDPQSAPARVARARIRRARGDRPGALDDAQQALALEERPRDLAATKALLAEIQASAPK